MRFFYFKYKILKILEVSDLEEATDSDMRVKQRKEDNQEGNKKLYNMRQRNRGDIDFEPERIENHTFAMIRAIFQKTNKQNSQL